MNVGSDGMGSWSYEFVLPLLQRTFPHTTITQDATRPYDLVVRSHFTHMERLPSYKCPYIVWSGESRPVPLLQDRAPLFELNTYHAARPNSIWFPHLIAECRETRRPELNQPKQYCCAYAFSNPILERELLFRKMRSLEPTCYSFGRSCPTNDNPFVAPAAYRQSNSKHFVKFAYNVAMENAIVSGYMTEKIGNAFMSGSVPIYWGDTDTVNDIFNPASFLNVQDYANVVKAAEAAVHIWRDPHKFQTYLDAPITLNNKLADYEAIYTEYRPWQKPMVDRLRDAFPDLS
jgi:hypothetical protein